jgi:PAS domain S-box-containing protein
MSIRTSEERVMTDKKSDADALRASEARLSKIFHTSSNAMAVTDFDSGRIVEINATWIRASGLSREEAIGKTAFELGLWLDAANREDCLAELKKSGCLRDYEITLLMKSKERIYLATAEVMVLEAEHSILWEFHDITERRQMEDELRKSERHVKELLAESEKSRLALLSILEDERRAQEALRAKTEELDRYFTLSLDLLCIADTDGYFHRLNPQWEQTLGYTLAELEGKRFLDLVHPDDLEATLVAVSQLEKQERVLGFENRYRCKDGSYRWIEWRSFPAGKLIYAAARDITERKQAEEALRASERQYRLLFENMVSGFALHEIICDEGGQAVDYRFLEVNPAFEILTGLQAKDILGKTVREVILGIEEEWIERYGRVALSGEPSEFESYAQGLGRYYEVRAFCPEIGKFATLFHDVTERIQTEALRRQAEEQVKQALAEKEALLRELYHRTKNNMQIIIALLKMQAASAGDARVEAILRDTQSRIHSMALVHQKLYEAQDLSRVNLKEYVGDLVKLMLASYQMVPDQVSFISEMDDVSVLIDTAIPCGLILNELLSNALKHAFPAGQPGEIRLRLGRTESGEIQIRVADNGVGVPAGFDFRQHGKLGMRTILILGETQLGGQVSFEAGPGVTCVVQFKDDSYQPRV